MHLSISPICQTYFQVHFKYRVFSLAFHVHDSHCSCESVSQIPGQSPRAHTRLANLVPTFQVHFLQLHGSSVGKCNVSAK